MKDGRLEPELQALLDPQERFEQLRKRCAMRAGKRLADLSYANPYDDPDPAVVEALREAVTGGRKLDLQYTPYGGATITRRLVAEALSESHDRAFRWRDVILAPGAMAALNIAFRAMRGANEAAEVLMPTPCWLDYPLYLKQLGMTPVPVPLRTGDFRLDLEMLGRAIGPRTVGVVLTQPGNPTGLIHDGGELGGLAALLDRASEGRERPLLLVSDECHRDVVFEPHRFVSPVGHYRNTLVVYSFGKVHSIQGQRTGYLALSPDCEGRAELSTLLERLCRSMGFCTPTALMQRAVPSLLRQRPALDRIARRRETILRELRAFGYEVVPSQATFFVYARCPIPDDFEFVERLAERGLLVLPSSMFHQRGWFRLSLTASDEMVERSLPIFEEASS